MSANKAYHMRQLTSMIPSMISNVHDEVLKWKDVVNAFSRDEVDLFIVVCGELFHHRQRLILNTGPFPISIRSVIRLHAGTSASGIPLKRFSQSQSDSRRWITVA